MYSGLKIVSAATASICAVALLAGVCHADQRPVTGFSDRQSTQLDAMFHDYTQLKENPWENWQLTEQEWKKYETILEKTPWAVWDHSATPYQILAIYASTIQEKRRYARLEAQLNVWREDTAITYQQIYNREHERVFAHYSSIVRHQNPTIGNLSPGDQIVMFTQATRCNTRCIALVNRLLEAGPKVDVFVINAQSDQEIFDWAKSANIPRDLVHIGHITLNFEEGEFDRISTLPAVLVDMPIAYIKRGQEYQRLAL